MKICFFCDTIFSYGGVQRVLAMIAKTLSKKHEVTILTLENESKADKSLYDLNRSAIRFCYFQFNQPTSWTNFTHKTYSYLYKNILPQNRCTSYLYGKSSFPRCMRQQLIATLNNGSYDVVIGVHAFLSMKLATIRPQLQAKKVMGWMHNSYQAFFEMQPAYLEGLKSHFNYQIHRLDEVIVLTHTDAEHYKEQFGLTPTVIYNPLTIKPHGVCTPEAKKFLAVGRMSPRHKGFDLLIDAFTLFAQENDDWTLDIVGEGPEEASLRNQIYTYQMEDRIHLHPFTNDIGHYYQAASVFVLSSRWEGMPLVLVEAMSYGLPIIASDIPICKEILKNKTFCTFFKNKSAISLYQAMRAKAAMSSSFEQQIPFITQYAQTFGESTIMKQWQHLLTQP